MRIANEKGIALVLSLFLMTVMSVLGASLMFLSQTETYSSMNYRLMSQARYGAESGIQKAANFLIYSTSYTAPPGTAGADPITSYDITVSPVTCTTATGCPTNGPVVLSGSSTQASNYPVAGVQAAFLAAVQGTLSAGDTTVAYAPYATLMSMQQFVAHGGLVQTIQTWQITAAGTIKAGKTAQVEVSAVLETPKLPAQLYAAFATGAGCGALTFSGNLTTSTDSYDSSVAFAAGQTAPTISLSGGNVGTNGNLTQAGQSTINGTLSSPRVGVGNCSGGNVDALSSSGGATVNGHSPPLPGDLIQLPQAVTLAPPAAPDPLPPTTTFDGDDLTLPSVLNPGPFGDVTVSNNKTLTLGALGVTTYITMNTFTMSGNADLVILGTVILNVADQEGVTTPITFTGNVTSGNVGSEKFNPSNFQIRYAGTGEIKVTGNSSLTAMIYAPNAAAKFSGGADFYGAVVAGTVSDIGGASIHYDRNLSSKFFTAGNPMMSAFNWKKY